MKIPQLIEDTLDYKAGGANLLPGLATSPVIYASEEHPELRQLIQRNFAAEGDIELVGNPLPVLILAEL